MSELIHQIPFHGGHIEALEKDGKHWVVVKRVCENLGLAWQPQHAKLSSLPWAVVTMIVMTGLDGKRYEMCCADLDTLLMWLATINPGKVNLAAREALVEYQKHVKKVIADYFLGRHPAQDASEKQLDTGEEGKMSELIHVPFHQGEILAVKDERGEWVVIKPLCQTLGIDVQAQQRRIQRAAWGASKGTAMIAVPSAGGSQDTFCLHRKRIAMWLATLEVSRVRPEIQPYLALLQDEAADVLDAYFSGKLAQPSRATELEALRHELNALRKQLASGVVGEEVAGALVRGVIRQIATYETLDQDGSLRHWRKKTEEHIRGIVGHRLSWGLLPREQLGFVQGVLDLALRRAREAAARRNALRQREMRV